MFGRSRGGTKGGILIPGRKIGALGGFQEAVGQTEFVVNQKLGLAHGSLPINEGVQT